MKEKRISIPIMRLIGFVTGFVCITVAGHSFIRSTIKFIRRTIGELGEALKKGMPINDYDEDETQETEEAATEETATETAPTETE